MIHRIYSSLHTFKEVRFASGLSVLLADKTERATDRQTRNSAGKSSLVDIVRFLLGGNADPQSIFRNKALVTHRFGIEFDLDGECVTVERTGQQPSRIIVLSGSTDTWPYQPSFEESLGALTLSVNQWKEVLHSKVFGFDTGKDLRAVAGSNDEVGSEPTVAPTFSSLLSYFTRRQSSGGFSTPIKQSSMQQPVDYQMAISFLLGLDWSIPARWQSIREREKQLKQLKKAARQGAFGSVIGTVADLRTELAVAEAETEALRKQVERFDVLPQYRSLEAEATILGQRLGELADENSIDRQVIGELESALRQEVESPIHDLERVFYEAGVVLGDAVVRSYIEARKFHESIVRNRRSYLSGEIEAARQRVETRNLEVEKFASRQTEIMGVLYSRGALDQFTAIQSELVRKQAETEAIKQRFFAAEQLEGTKTELDIERGQLMLRLQQDYREQEQRIRHAIVVFQDFSMALYEDAGSLTISESSNGPQFELRIMGERSKGINNMQIFCFDMMLMQICAERGIGPGFLIHDSHLFDGVDERQIATALRLGMDTADRFGFQYIVTMNSDDVPTEFVGEGEFWSRILPVKLTDATDEGGLFGIRF